MPQSHSLKKKKYKKDKPILNFILFFFYIKKKTIYNKIILFIHYCFFLFYIK